MGYLSSALAIGTILIDKVATLLREESERWRRELQHRESEADRQRDEAVVSAARQIVEIIEHVFRRNEEAAPEREEAALQMEVAANLREEAALAEAEKAKEALQQGRISPVVMPTPEQIIAAKERIQYNPVHFAVCGVSGGGKSSIINAIRGLRNNGHGAARVGVTKCTSKITRHPRSKQVPYSPFVWYDIPGAGTSVVSDWQYFKDQVLFVFEVIILVYDVCFTAIDVDIIENCLRFNISLLIVRSKADQHIANVMQARDCEPGDEDYDEVYHEMVKKYVEATRLDFDKHMQTVAEGSELDARDRQMLLGQRVYIVAAAALRSLSESRASYREIANKSKIIDDNLLLDDVTEAAVRVALGSGQQVGDKD